jgi:hypothetical protein
MQFKRKFVATLIAGSMAAASTIFAEAASVNISIGTPPPPIIVETAPPPRAGHVWVNGYWRWNGARHVWVKGHWVVARRGYHYVPESWVNVNGRWVFHPGHWAR